MMIRFFIIFLWSSACYSQSELILNFDAISKDGIHQVDQLNDEIYIISKKTKFVYNKKNNKTSEKKYLYHGEIVGSAFYKDSTFVFLISRNMNNFLVLDDSLINLDFREEIFCFHGLAYSDSAFLIVGDQYKYELALSNNNIIINHKSDTYGNIIDIKSHFKGYYLIFYENLSIEIYDKSHRLISSFMIDDRVINSFDVDIHPSGKYLLVSIYADKIGKNYENIKIYDLKGNKKTSLDNYSDIMMISMNYIKGVFSEDGENVYACSLHPWGSIPPGKSSFSNGFRFQNDISKWPHSGFGARKSVSFGFNPFSEMRATPDGILFASNYPEWGLFGYDDEIKIHKVRELHRFSPMSDVHLAVNDDGTEIGFRPKVYPYVSFSLLEERQDTVRSAHPEFREEAGDTFVNDWKRKTKPKVRVFSPQFMSDGEECLSVDVSDDGERVVFGSERHLCLTDGFGRVQWNVPMSEMAVAVNLSGNGKIVVVADYQGLIHWYSAQDGQLLLTLYSHTDAKRWIAYTPDGYFAASARDAEDLVGWLHEQEDSPFGRFEPLGDRRKSHRRPDLLRRIIQLGDAQAAKKELGLE